MNLADSALVGARQRWWAMSQVVLQVSHPPWSKRTHRTGTTLALGIEIASTLRTLMHPYLPDGAAKLHASLAGSGELSDIGWNNPTPSTGTQLPKPSPIFTKLDDAMVEEELARHESPVEGKAV